MGHRVVSHKNHFRPNYYDKNVIALKLRSIKRNFTYSVTFAAFKIFLAGFRVKMAKI